MTKTTDSSLTRRGVMKGIGGLAALSMSSATPAEAQEVLNNPLPTDPHTRDTYRAIVDAIVPRTPELEDELGPEHVPGGLDAELEKFLIWDFNHFQEIRLEALATPLLSDGMSPETFEVSFDSTSGLDDLLGTSELSDLDAVNQMTDTDVLDVLSHPQAVEDLLDFGAIERFEISFADDLSSTNSGPADFDLVVETGNETTHRVVQNYPYAPLFPFVFDIVAAEFVALGKNEDAVSRGDERFAGGGTFVQLSREDRLRCLWTIVDGGAVDRLDELLSPFVPHLGILKFVVMAINGLHGFGYYTEWSGYGSTKTDMPSDRELITPAGEVQSRKQTEYPGPAPGYAADWRHVIPGSFEDPKAKNLDLSGDLKGSDVIEGIGGDGT